MLRPFIFPLRDSLRKCKCEIAQRHVESIERGMRIGRRVASGRVGWAGRGGELERAKLRICKCGAHNNGVLLYADAVGCVAWQTRRPMRI